MVGVSDDSADLDGLADLLDNVVGEAKSEGGLVGVKVDSRGRVTQVWLDERVSRVPYSLFRKKFRRRPVPLYEVLVQRRRTTEFPYK